jgi:hypothetical protein
MSTKEDLLCIFWSFIYFLCILEVYTISEIFKG